MQTTLLTKEEYYSQRNNKIQANSACMPTARVMFYKANKISYENSMVDKYADDDYFMYLLNTAEAKSFCYTKYPWAYNVKEPQKSIPPNEVHGMYSSYLDEKVCGKKVSSFEEQALDWNYFVSSITNRKKAIMTSGTFGTIKGHAVLVMGYDDETQELLLADPYGNYRTQYKDINGYCTRMTKEEFDIHLKPTDSFMKNGHIPL